MNGARSDQCTHHNCAPIHQCLPVLLPSHMSPHDTQAPPLVSSVELRQHVFDEVLSQRKRQAPRDKLGEARTKGMEPARTVAANQTICSDVCVPCGQARFDPGWTQSAIKPTYACRFGGRCRLRVLEHFENNAAVYKEEIEIERGGRNLRFSRPYDRADCWPETELFSHTLHMKKLWDCNFTLWQTEVCPVAAGYFTGHTDYCLKEASAWNADPSWVDKKTA
jgi:hypothetical protein